MSKEIISIGDQFDYWTVIGKAENGVQGHLRYICKCKCGTVKSVDGESLRIGDSKSCGCRVKDYPPNVTHGMAGTRIYQIWIGIKKTMSSYSKRSP